MNPIKDSGMFGNDLSPLNNLEGSDTLSTPSIYYKKPLTKKQKNNRKKAKSAKKARRHNRK